MIRSVAIKLLGSALTLFALSGTAHAGLLGATVEGTLDYDATGLNWWPNSTAVIDNTNEFVYEYPIPGEHQNTVNFTDTDVLIISEYDYTPYGMALPAPSWTMTFQSAAFIGSTLSPILDLFPGGITASLVGDLLTVMWGGATVDQGIFAVAFTFVSDPVDPVAVASPAPLVLLALGLGCLGLVRRRA